MKIRISNVPHISDINLETEYFFPIFNKLWATSLIKISDIVLATPPCCLLDQPHHHRSGNLPTTLYGPYPWNPATPNSNHPITQILGKLGFAWVFGCRVRYAVGGTQQSLCRMYLNCCLEHSTNKETPVVQAAARLPAATAAHLWCHRSRPLPMNRFPA